MPKPAPPACESLLVHERDAAELVWVVPGFAADGNDGGTEDTDEEKRAEGEDQFEGEFHCAEGDEETGALFGDWGRVEDVREVGWGLAGVDYAPKVGVVGDEGLEDVEEKDIADEEVGVVSEEGSAIVEGRNYRWASGLGTVCI